MVLVDPPIDQCEHISDNDTTGLGTLLIYPYTPLEIQHSQPLRTGDVLSQSAGDCLPAHDPPAAAAAVRPLAAAAAC